VPLRAFLSGWSLFAILSGAVVAATWLVFAGQDDATESARAALRLTARTSLILFGLAFAASSLLRIWPTPVTRWLARNRRYVGLSFAVSHFVHGGAIVALAVVNPEYFHVHTNVVINVGGGLAYVLIAAMVATSFDRTAAWLGPKWWRRLHVTGNYFVWLIFTLNFVGLTVQDVSYWPFAAYALAILVVRLLGIKRSRGAPAAI